MLGSIAGDIIGSVYEHDNIKITEFELFGRECRFTDDSVLTTATHNHPEGLPLRRQLPGLGPAGDKGVHRIEGF